MTKQELISENTDHMTDESLAAIEQIPEAAWDSVTTIALDENGWDEIGLNCDVSITHETLEDFDNSRINHWSERGQRSEIEANGFKAIGYSGLQIAKGQQRKEMIVVDCGDVRACLSL
jgi:hypothetical protein